ncbi:MULTISPECIES: cyclase family protein [unclassified Aureispira]|uniref:cyclase family protein n=1 Tax=unclassified Aureispira TaxID=2649989 RepID=UPI0006974A88|nr:MULTISPECIES: cyclase family protein [unclassified Aureispira]WMX14831.1 cyclase family protein [Aureispira sp. CCB-E]
MAKIIDLSKTIQYDKEDPWFMRIKIKHISHLKNMRLIRYILKLPKKLIPARFQGWANDKIVNMGVHASTHIDAPWHYGPVVEGKKAKTIDEVPLDWLYGDGVVIDMSHKADFDAITVEDLEKALAQTQTTLQPGNIVLIRTDRDHLKGKDVLALGTGMSKEATLWLIQKGIKVMGIDQWGWDLPLKYLVEEAKKTNNKELFWEGHLVGLDHEYLHMEQLTNLKALPPHGFKIAVFPLKIKGASAAPARVVAIMESA